MPAVQAPGKPMLQREGILPVAKRRGFNEAGVQQDADALNRRQVWHFTDIGRGYGYGGFTRYDGDVDKDGWPETGINCTSGAAASPTGVPDSRDSSNQGYVNRGYG